MAKPKQNALRSWLVILLIVLAFMSMYRMGPSSAPKTEELTLLDFFKKIDEGKILDPVTRVIDREAGDATWLTGEMETDELITSDDPKLNGTAVRKRYRVALIPGENEKLMEDLLASNIQVKIEEKRSVIPAFVFPTLFFVGMLALFYWFMNAKMNGSHGPFGFGKSKAKLLNSSENKKKITFADVAGVDEAREEVQEIVEFLKKPSDFTKLGGKIPKGVLLVGPPGTGKTLLAKAIAGEANVPFFAMSGSDFEEMFVGVGASRMRDVFSEAKKNAPCIVFIDEIDSIGMKRTGAGAMGGSHAYEQTLNTMLVEMDGFDANEGVIVIAATNRPDTLDSALLRPGRFDRQVVVELPTLKGREEILALHGKKIKFAEGVDLKRIARGTPGCSGADLANLLNEAALLATRKKLEAVDEKTLEEARDKVLWGRERKSAGYSQKERETTAWHESGHAVLQLLAKNADPLHKVTIIPRGRALGLTASLPDHDVLNRTRNYFLDEMVICCGGRIAETMFTGDLSTGAAQDIAQTTAIAREMVCKYGMSEKFGFQAFSERNEWSAAELPPAFSEETSRAIDAEVSKIVNEAYAKAERLLNDNRDKVERLAKTLLEKETMDGREVAELLGIVKESEEERAKSEELRSEASSDSQQTTTNS